MTELLLPPPAPPTIDEELADLRLFSDPAVQRYFHESEARRAWVLAEAVAIVSPWRTPDLRRLHRRIELDSRPPSVPREHELTVFRADGAHHRALMLCLYQLGGFRLDYIRAWVHVLRRAQRYPCERGALLSLRAVRPRARCPLAS